MESKTTSYSSGFGTILEINVREGAIKNGQSRETVNIGHTRRRKTKQKHISLHEDMFTNSKISFSLLGMHVNMYMYKWKLRYNVF